MGEKGSKSTAATQKAAEEAFEKLKSLGDVTLKKMFGGYGLFESKKMFALISPEGRLYFKVNDTNRQQYQEAGSKQHLKMPYFQVPEQILNNDHLLREWARVSIGIAKG